MGQSYSLHHAHFGSRLSAVFTIVFGLFAASVLGDGVTCGAGQNCPESLPCCYQYGQCGVGAYCLGGCDPLFSHSLDSCMPAPICTNKNIKMTSVSDIIPNTKYMGNSSKGDWVSSGTPAPYPQNDPDSVLLTMPKNSMGTLLASTAYVWYGKISATFKTSRTQGVVTAFILLSDVKDEIDWEFVGSDLTQAQSNYYFQGIPIYTHSMNHTVSSDTFANYHTYELDWQPDTLTWSIDGTVVRTLHRSDTWNSTANQYYYPQTPSRVQLSLWPAGLSSNGQGTVEWAGGLINWNSPDIENVGYFYAQFKEVDITCYEPPSDAIVKGNTSYIYTDDSGLENTVEISGDQTVLSSLEDTGLNPSASAAASGTGAPNVPGMGSTGSGTSGDRGGSGSGSPGAVQSTFHGWSQGGSGSGASPLADERTVHGSMLAVVIVIAALLIM